LLYCSRRQQFHFHLMAPFRAHGPFRECLVYYRASRHASICNVCALGCQTVLQARQPPLTVGRAMLRTMTDGIN
jgi:hypothetical protein